MNRNIPKTIRLVTANIHTRQFFSACKTRLIHTSFYAALSGLALSPAHADRHCLPSQDAFYAGRYALQDEAQACSAALAEATNALETAREYAEICGCSELTSMLTELIGKTRDNTLECQVRAEGILERTEQVKTLVSDCH